jgi:hypothetical protein
MMPDMEVLVPGHNNFHIGHWRAIDCFVTKKHVFPLERWSKSVLTRLFTRGFAKET